MSAYQPREFVNPDQAGLAEILRDELSSIAVALNAHIAQLEAQGAIASLTDSTGGSADGSLEAVSGSGADAAINNNFAEIHAKLDSILNALRNLGLIAS